MIRVSGLVKTFNGVQVLDRLDLAVAPGEILAVMGPSGTGKSVLLQHLVGLMSPDAGTVEVDGIDVATLDEKGLLLLRQRMGYLFQEAALYDFMTVEENLAFPLREHAKLGEAKVAARVMRFLEMVDMADSGGKYPAELSGGMKKRAALARAMINDAKVLLCDEPTSGLDPVRSRDISLLIRRLSKEFGCTTVLTSHDVINALRTADRAVVLNDGKVAASGREEELRASTDPFVRDFVTI